MAADITEMRQSPLILVVDDDPLQTVLICEALTNAGFRSAHAENGVGGLRKVEDLNPDLVILDVMMPDIDGFEVCARLRQPDLAPNLPVLMVTGLDDHKSMERAFEVGSTNFLTKPVDFSLIHYHVKTMLRASRIEWEIRDARRVAEEASLSKTQFLANTSHELRTPLNAIIGFSELMFSEIMGPLGHSNYKQYADDITQSGRHLLELLNDILDISKIECGKLEMRRHPCDLQEIFERVSWLTKSRAVDAGVALDFHAGPEVSDLYADELRLKQVLINLVSNAVKFSRRGDKVSVRAAWSNQGKLVIEVADTGIGIPQDKIEKAMSMFGQVDAGLDRCHEGTGLGLPLSKAITQLLGGKFILNSQAGRGTAVTLEFPRKAISSQQTDAGRKSA
jgi:signal transduction histidine kinase